MEKSSLLKMLLPALAGAALLGLVLFLVIGPADPNDGGNPVPGQPGPSRNSAVTPESQRTTDVSAEKMAKSLPPVDAPEYKDFGKGLKVLDVVDGAGDPCPDGATITIHYAGWLVPNGSMFDSTYLRKSPPATFGLSGLIKGWQLGIPGMKPGGIRRLIIPSALGYGPQGSGAIPGGATLCFEIKLIEWK
jgi:FKBP-type peptidyl-prolyl cis-trans isomerase